MKQKHYIDSHKGATFIYILALIYFFQDAGSIDNTTIYNTVRVGKITWHGPGQRIIYFMIDIKKRKYDIRKFVSNIENYIIISLKELEIKAFKKKDLIGIWAKDKEKNDAKIASLGLSKFIFSVIICIFFCSLYVGLIKEISNFNFMLLLIQI